MDAHRCLQVLANLLSNAAKFSPPDATVDISLQTVDGYARVSIRDYGPGIPEEFKSRIFGKFAQAATNAHGKSGTGLGLSISKAIVERMGGRIGFDSIINPGTIFFFDVPIASDDRQQQVD